jgi:hypothetical protein
MHQNAALLEHLLRELLSHQCALLAFYFEASLSAEDALSIRRGITILETVAYTADVALSFIDKGINCPSPDPGVCSTLKTVSNIAALIVQTVTETVSQRRRFDE